MACGAATNYGDARGCHIALSSLRNQADSYDDSIGAALDGAR